MQVNREQFLTTLQVVSPGLSPREIIEQSSCFVFKDGQVITFNDEVACSAPCKAKIEGAVQAAPLLQILQLLQEEVLEIRQTDKELQLKGKGRVTAIAMDAEVHLPIEDLEKPGKWTPLPDGFDDAVNLVESCASRDDSQFKWTCIHIHPNWIEASDIYQIARFRMKTGFKSSLLVRQKALQHIINQGMVEFSETKEWIHFRNSAKMILACRRHTIAYPNITKHLQITGEKTMLPKGLVQAAEKAAVFSNDNADDNTILVTLERGRVRIKGEGVFGWYSESKKIKYGGKPIKFRIAPKQLCEIIRREHNNYEMTDGALKVESGKFVYVTSLAPPEQQKPHEETKKKKTSKKSA